MKKQITIVLPRSAWDKVLFNEIIDPLVFVEETKKLKFGLVTKRYKPLFIVRKSVAKKLYIVSENLPEEVVLILIEGYRTMRAQQGEWDNVLLKIKEENPKLTNVQLEEQVRLLVAKPSPWANHHCGGAVDVTLACKNGRSFDMGTPYISEAKMEDKEKFPMLSDEITDEQKQNRKILREAMEKEDFVWYPGEWWHYCWGDRMWAVYSNQSEYFYGPTYLKTE